MAATAVIMSSLPRVKGRVGGTEWHRKELCLLDYVFLMVGKNYFPVNSPENISLFLCIVPALEEESSFSQIKESD